MNWTEIHVVFDGPPGPDAGRFVEVEDANGKSISVGRWEQRGNYWRLIINGAPERDADALRNQVDALTRERDDALRTAAEDAKQAAETRQKFFERLTISERERDEARALGHAANCERDELADSIQMMKSDADALRAENERLRAEKSLLRKDYDALGAQYDELHAWASDAMHASAPAGLRCSDCAIDKHPCLDCYASWWLKQHPNSHQVGGVAELVRAALTPASAVAKGGA